MTGELAPDRRIFELGGKDAIPFLQGMVSNDLLPLAKGEGIVWAALLTPQGKYLADFFVVNTAGNLLVDIKDSVADPTLRRLSMYKLRADVSLTPLEMPVTRGLGACPSGALPDPRHPALGWRAYGRTGPEPTIDWDAIRVTHCIPETSLELIPEESYILECGFERLHGVDFRKGCYVGQEVTARMKHKTELRKGLRLMAIDGSAPVGTSIMQGEKEAGTVFTQSGGVAISHLRFDRMDGLTAGSANLTPM